MLEYFFLFDIFFTTVELPFKTQFIIYPCCYQLLLITIFAAIGLELCCKIEQAILSLFVDCFWDYFNTKELFLCNPDDRSLFHKVIRWSLVNRLVTGQIKHYLLLINTYWVWKHTLTWHNVQFYIHSVFRNHVFICHNFR